MLGNRDVKVFLIKKKITAITLFIGVGNKLTDLGQCLLLVC